MSELRETRDWDSLAPSTSPGSRRRAWLWRGLQLVATVAAFAYVLSLVSMKTLFEALVRVPFGIFVAAALITIIALVIGALRWWLLFRAFGAPRLPELVTLVRYYFVGFFYNTYLPGGVGGDLVRALASRRAWGAEHAATAGIAIVFVDRVLGLAGLLGVVSLVSFVHPLPVLGSSVLPGVLGLAGVALCLFALSSARWLALRAPAWLGRLLERLPVASRWLPLMAAGGLSFLTQLLPAISGYLLLRTLAPDTHLLDSLAIVPIAAASAFLPITVSGAGVREALFVKLYASVGVPASAALAASLLLWCSQACVAAVGGLHTLWHPLGNER
jgi:glycosyltransferase 2 family protein